MKRFLLFLILVASMISLHATNDTIYRNLSVIQADSLIQANTGNPDFIIIDLRQATPFANGHIANAINIDYYDPNFSTILDALDHSKKYLIHCQSGARSGLTFTMMQNKHFKEVYNMLGGITAWISAGYPTVTGTIISENNINYSVSIVYPNPVSDNSVIQIESTDFSNAQIEIFDMSGRNIYTIPAIANIISLSQYIFKKGEYFYLITSSDRVLSTGKFAVIE
jgi:phage shock protein E